MRMRSHNNREKRIKELFEKAKADYALHLDCSMELIRLTWELTREEPDSREFLDRIYTEAHKIAGSSATFGFVDLSRRAAALEALVEEHRSKGKRGSSGRIAGIDAAISEVASLADAAMAEIVREFGEPGGTGQSTGIQNDQDDARPSRRVLIVDDDAVFRTLLRDVLTECGMEVIEASNGRDGFSEAFYGQPDIIVSDYVMPEGSGHYLLGRLMTSPQTAAIPVIVVSAMQFDGGDQSLRREMDGYPSVTDCMQKPSAINELVGAIHARLTLH